MARGAERGGGEGVDIVTARVGGSRCSGEVVDTTADEGGVVRG